MVLRALHLCSGYGGFELALRGIARTVAHVERDAYAAATLVARMEGAQLDRAPIWDDLATFDGRPWRGRVDIVTAGFPCQPFSTAGKRAGVDDDRWLWPQIARIVGDVGPRYVFLENVPGLVRRGLPYVLADLAALGFDAEWGLLSAAAVGAPHKRERWWLVADAAGERRVSGDRPAARRRGAEPAPDGHRFPPRPDDDDGWQRWIDAGKTAPALRRGADGLAAGVESADHLWLPDRLHLLGNGLVPQCAREAWHQLSARLAQPTIDN